MTIELGWDNDLHTALLYQFPQKWTWDEFYSVKVEADALLDQSSHDVVLIFDLTATEGIPSGALMQARTLIRRAHPRGKPIVLVSSNMVIVAMLNLVNRFNMGATDIIKAVATLEEARQFAGG
jgi:hypothetical protein